jgi:N-acetylated-alpha-linked acidic dipeptidase
MYDTASQIHKIVPNQAQDLNAKLIEASHALTDEVGLPNRPWFKNLIYAPGAYTGYGVRTIPGVREGLETESLASCRMQIHRVADALNRESDLIDEATRALER